MAYQEQDISNLLGHVRYQLFALLSAPIILKGYRQDKHISIMNEACNFLSNDLVHFLKMQRILEYKRRFQIYRYTDIGQSQMCSFCY